MVSEGSWSATNTEWALDFQAAHVAIFHGGNRNDSISAGSQKRG